MSPNWDGLRDVVTAYVSDVAPPGGDSPRAIVLAAIDRLRAALERPRPAPPEPSEAQLIAQFNERAEYNAAWWHVRPTFYDALPEGQRKYQLENERAQWGIVMRGGTAGTGAAPPDYAALAEAYMDERVLTKTIPRTRPDLVRDFAKWLAIRGGAAQPPPSAPESKP